MMKAQIENPLFQVAEIKVSYHPKIKVSERPKIQSSRDAYQVLWANWDLDQLEFREQFYILLLNRANRVIGMSEISSGGLTGTVADPKVIFNIALKGCATNIILAHNHPSGTSQPSVADITITKKLVAGGALLDLFVLDHVILTAEGYYSFADEGLI